MDTVPEELCCDRHERSSLLADESSYEYESHIRGDDVPCSACHAPQGVDSSTGDSSNSDTHLMDVDTGIVSARSSGDLYFKECGKHAGACALDCHNKDHDDWWYTENDSGDSPQGN